MKKNIRNNFISISHITKRAGEILLFLCMTIGVLPNTGLAQQPVEGSIVSDTTLTTETSDLSNIQHQVNHKHSPKKATLFSMAIPGLGQAYNKKYWKIPIIYAGFAGVGYMIHDNTKEYNLFREAYIYELNKTEDPLTGPQKPENNPYVDRYTDKESLRQGRNYYRRQMEYYYILGAFWYIINVLDATVDAHFFDYNITNDLSLHLEPAIGMPMPGKTPYSGVALTLRW